jgi:outer membrane protein assembly factor BamA
VGPDSIDAYTETFSSVTALALTDTRDRRSAPSRGVRLDARGELATGLLGGPVFQHVSVDGEGLLPLGWGVSLYGRTAWTQGYGRDLPRHYRTVLGGVEVLPLLPGRRFPLYGTDSQALVGRAGQLAAAGVQWTGAGNLFARLTVQSGRVGRNWTLDADAFRTGVGLTMGTRTPIGPVRLILSNDTLTDAPHVTLSAGYRF